MGIIPQDLLVNLIIIIIRFINDNQHTKQCEF